MIPGTPIPLDGTACDERRDPYQHEDMHADDWPIMAAIIVAAMAIPFLAGFTLGRIWG